MQPAPRFLPAIRRWLTVCLVLVALMVLIGGVTRLTESGLSIVKWDLVAGTLPPLSDAAWDAQFRDYQTSPQFQKVNATFTLADFQQIFWLEYLHRLLGRVIGLAIFIPYLYFLARRALPPRLARRGAALVVLVGLQGTVGWVMVASGLVAEPRVAPIKLGLHLLLAFTLFATLLWTRWQVAGTPHTPAPHWVNATARLLLALTTVQIFAGALVAGLRAGKSYNTYPLMDNQLVPAGLHAMHPWWLNHLESVATVQFQHRMLAVLVAAAVLAFAAGSRHLSRRLRVALGGTVCLQFLLGVATLLSVVNIALASAHQLGALLLFSVLLRVCYRTAHSRT